MVALTPTVHAKINGTDAVFVADSGAFFSTLTTGSAARFHLTLGPAPVNIVGVGGEARVWLAKVDTFTIINRDIPRVPFLVTGNDLGSGIVGLLGQNLLHIGDVEYDLANGAIRLVNAKGDCKKASLAYWANAKGQPYSMIEIESGSQGSPHTRAVVYVNGKKMRAMFDSGAAVSVLTLAAAKRAGVTPQTSGVVYDGESYGIGTRVAATYIAPFDSFKIGDEEVQHTKLRIGGLDLDEEDMLIGADFFLSHRLLVASSQRRLYFTYNGGPVFNLTATPAAGAAAAGSAAATTGGEAVAGETSLDAAAYARRGAAETSRHDYEHAIADLTRACELAPTQADYFYERGRANEATRHGDLALADYDRAVTLRPDDVPALLARATLHAARHDATAVVVADLDTIDRTAPKQDEVRLALAELYQQVGNSGAAIAEYGYWINSHNRDEIGMAEALNARCWTRALAGTELEQALDDCDRAVRIRANRADILDSRGLVHLRMGHYDKAISDYDAALRLAPKIVWSLYGRGIAKLRTGQTAAGQADIAAAVALSPDIAKEAEDYGIKP
jgi:tetratricopeptide (TPR) repeat protein